ncbi:hypothetical protein AAZX31_04G139200 [Glycine max]|uniref:Uncharacterized protein n=2 Tax=Glycine subgen. Soja TaxID=1462606 RepID=A0A0R0KFX4_SOYBN|nr:hypothetical protein JHK87_010142 [Glycine soja]KAG5049454.1 hypothetical protein JHK85_010557 [Glycine max]KAG5066546.1 hypothetical protein JHK86_010277 [Glycine max]KAH1111475.1 hypothetical protein GYH30_010031 [Glycine max]KHN09911.1 hypothetical protein glysoja_042514 [Glycine soja]
MISRSGYAYTLLCLLCSNLLLIKVYEKAGKRGSLVQVWKVIQNFRLKVLYNSFGTLNNSLKDWVK